MFGVPISQYGDTSVFNFKEDLPIPRINSSQILIEVKAVSVNPIDLMKREGIGRTIFERQRKELFPWILGCDVSGKVVEVGSKISSFTIGDEVWGCTNTGRGTYAQYAILNQDELAQKPSKLTFEESASMPYVALTTWVSFIRWASLRPQDLDQKKVLVHAGAGGVGSFAIQLLKNWGAEVATTCSKKNKELVRDLGADTIIDYNQEDFSEILSNYDVVLDTLGYIKGEDLIKKSMSILKVSSSSHYITLVHPFLKILDEKGLIRGIPQALALRHKEKRDNKPINVHWSLYRPNLSALEELGRIVESGQIKPVIDSVFSLKDLGKAHEKVASSHSSGKVVIKVS